MVTASVLGAASGTALFLFWTAIWWWGSVRNPTAERAKA